MQHFDCLVANNTTETKQTKLRNIYTAFTLHSTAALRSQTTPTHSGRYTIKFTARASSHTIRATILTAIAIIGQRITTFLRAVNEQSFDGRLLTDGRQTGPRGTALHTTNRMQTKKRKK